MMNIHKKCRGVLMAVMCLLLVILSGCSEKKTIKYVDLKEYMDIGDIGGYEGVAVVVNGENVGDGFAKDGAYYISYEVVREYIDSRYYWDDTMKMLTYASSKHIYDAYVGTTEYTKDDAKENHERDIVMCIDGVPYIDKDYVYLMNCAMNITTHGNPSRLVVTTVDKMSMREIISDIYLEADLTSSGKVVTDLKAGTLVTVIEAENGWAKVTTQDGLTGYVDWASLGSEKAVTIDRPASWLDSDPYTYIGMDELVCLGWHQMEYAGGNDSLNKMVSGADSLNVISPTWFKITDEYGGISSLASKSYVDNAHKKGLQVWGLISDFNYDSEGKYYVNDVLKNTTSRRNLIANIIKEAKNCGMDGINIDFEMVRLATAEGYVQFFRELAIECDKINLVLSVDMYVPASGNGYYDRTSVGEVVDYLVIMGYDEHWAGCGEAGSVASLPFVVEGIEDTLTEVPANRVINAVPFYCRVWYEDTLENAPEGSIIVEDAINGNYALSSKAVGLEDAADLIDRNNGSMRWIEELGQYYSEYYIGERLARIWLEEKESLTLKLNAMKERNLAGVACWKLGLDSDEAWDAIADYLK